MPQSSQPVPNDDSDLTEPDSFAIGIPVSARDWESAPRVASSVRRPSTLPDPASYHTAIEPEAIFELDEKQEDGSIETILVVSFSCTRCRGLKQFCSRTQPACIRCRKTMVNCRAIQEGYQRLPGPKIGKPSLLGKKTAASASGEKAKASSSASQEPTASRLRARRVASRGASLSMVPPSDSGPSIAPGSKRPLYSESEAVPPRKKTRARITLRKGKTRGHTVVASSEEMDIECSEAAMEPSEQVASAVASASGSSALKWTFVNNPRRRDEKSSRGQDHVDSIPSKTLIPRVWTNSFDRFLAVFPEIAKTPVGFSWFQSETPILLLDTNYAQGHWINSTTLTIDLLWDFSCYDFELEAIVKPDAGGAAELDYRQSVVHPPESASDRETHTMDLRHSYLSPSAGLFPAYQTVSAPLPTFSIGMLQLDSPPQCERHIDQNTCPNQARGRGPIRTATPNEAAPAVHSTQLYPRHLPPPENQPPSHLYPAPSEFLAHHTISQANPQPRIPLNKPTEVETLLNSQSHFIPFLVWISHDSGLLPCNLPREYAYSCMGLFFISDLHHTVMQYGISSTTGLVRGRVSWSVMLQWAPGGEDALFDCDPAPSSDMIPNSTPHDATKDLLHPWWFNPMDALSQADNTTSYRPRDLRMQCFSFIPLDLLADFHPSESFPRGWYCKSCGMINFQIFFRHQICQSSACESTREKRVPQGKVDSLSSLRDIYQSSTVIQPTSSVPSFVVSDSVTWDDGMQSWIYSVNDGVTLCHVFTGNQGHLQEDAAALLERIQREVLLRKEDPLSPYFTHTTRLTHPRDGSEVMVPGGTPDSVRIAYYTLCDLVHRYAEMDKPRFGKVLIQAWVTSGSKKGTVLRASTSPVVVHCLGVEVTLSFTPKGGYKDAAGLTAPDKGKGRVKEVDRTGSPPTNPLSEPSHHLEQAGGDQASASPGPKANQSPIVTAHVDEATAAMDTVHQRRGFDADYVAPGSNTPRSGPGMSPHEVAEPKQGRGRKKNFFIKEKSKASVPEISMTLLHGDCVVLSGDDFECQTVRNGTSILVIGFPEET